MQLKFALLISILLPLLGCSPESTTLYEDKSPNGKCSVSVVGYGDFFISKLRPKIILKCDRQTQELYRDDREDFGLCFAETAWDKNSERASIVVNNCYGHLIRVSVNTRNGSQLDKQLADNLIATKLLSTYRDELKGLEEKEQEIIQWCISHKAAVAFHERVGTERK